MGAKFEERWNLPNILGAIDGKRIILEQPINSGSRYHDYKGCDSIILMAVVGPEYEFLNVDVGMNGRMSDGGNCNGPEIVFERHSRMKIIRWKFLLPNRYLAETRASPMSL